MIEQEFVPYEEAFALKELGFNEPCFGYWKSKNWLIQEKTRTDGYTHADQECSAPTFSQAFKWFREKYNLYCFTLRQVGINTSDIFFISSYYKGKKGNSPMNTCIPSKTYEEAELACLRRLIEIVKTV